MTNCLCNDVYGSAVWTSGITIDPSFLDLAGTTVSDQPISLERDQTKRSYLHPVVGSEAARIGAGLLTR